MKYGKEHGHEGEKYQTSAKDLAIELPEESETLHHRLD